MVKIILMSIPLLLLLQSVSGMVVRFEKPTITFRDTGPAAFDNNLSITVQPVDLADCKGNKVTFSVATEGGTGKIHYLWKRKRPADTAFATFGAADSIRLPVYNIGVGKEAPNGTLYQVTVTDQTNQVISQSASLTVNEITGIAPSGVASYTVNEGTNLRFNVLTSGSTPLSFQWIKKFANNDWRNLVDNQIISGSQSEQLSFTKISLADSGIYKVRVSFPTVSGNQCAETSTITRTIHVKQVADTVPPTFVNLSNRNVTLCPEKIDQAVWDETCADIRPERTNYYILYKNSNLFDLATTDFHDNVTSASGLILHWGIWSGTPPLDPLADEAGTILEDMTGQISLHPENIDFGGKEGSIPIYRIIFWLEDGASNLTPESMRHTIDVKVAIRPQIVSMF